MRNDDAALRLLLWKARRQWPVGWAEKNQTKCRKGPASDAASSFASLAISDWPVIQLTSQKFERKTILNADSKHGLRKKKAMSGRRLKITLIGADQDDGNVEFSDFRQFCDSLTICLARIESKFPDAGIKRLHYRVVDLSTGSANISLEPIRLTNGRDIGRDVVDLFSKTISNIQAGKAVDPRLNVEDLWAFRRLAYPLNRKIKESRIADTKITSRFIANIDDLVGATIPSEGSVKGRLERLNVHNRFEFVIYPPIPGYSVTCTFRDELYEQIHQAVRKNVTVNGTLHYRPGRPFPDRVQVKSIEVHPPDEQLPKLADLRGAWKGCLGGHSSVEFIQANRDE